MKIAMLTALMCLGLAGCATSDRKTESGSAAETAEKSLYDRLGGRPAIEAVVSDLLKALGSNETLNANPKIAEARNRVNKEELKKKTVDFLCLVTGGPNEYEGRTMKESHAHLAISAGEWDAMIPGRVRTQKIVAADVS